MMCFTARKTPKCEGDEYWNMCDGVEKTARLRKSRDIPVLSYTLGDSDGLQPKSHTVYPSPISITYLHTIAKILVQFW